MKERVTCHMRCECGLSQQAMGSSPCGLACGFVFFFWLLGPCTCTTKASEMIHRIPKIHNSFLQEQHCNAFMLGAHVPSFHSEDIPPTKSILARMVCNINKKNAHLLMM